MSVNRRIGSNSKFNRDAREDAFRRAVIGYAQQHQHEAAARQRAADDAQAALPEADVCPLCNNPLPLDAEGRDGAWPYCSLQCANEAASDSEEDL